MSQIENAFRDFLSKQPEVEKCYASGLINRRSLARYLAKHKVVESNQVEATIAMLRRFDFNPKKTSPIVLHVVRINIKDNIVIIMLEKSKLLLKELQKIMNVMEYDHGDTFKVVVGTSSITLFIDKTNEKKIKHILNDFKINNKHDKLSEISVLVTEEMVSNKGTLALITRELFLNDIIISEILTANQELLVYLKEEDAVKAYQIIKSLQLK